MASRSARVWALTLLGLLAAGCHRDEVPPGFQGIVEHEERDLGFQVGGQVVSVAVDRGALVKSGQVVARLDDSLARPQRDARAAELATARAQLELLRAGSRPEEIRQAAAQLDSARATVSQVERNLARAQRLAKTGAKAAASVQNLEADLERARAQRRLLSQRLRLLRAGARPEEIAAAAARADAAKAQLAEAEKHLALYTLHAPLDGEVLDVVTRAGEVAAAGAPVLVIADTAHPYVDAFVPQGELAGLHIGTPARVATDSSGARLPAVVEYVGQRTEFTPRFLFSEQERPNLVVRVRVRIDDRQRTLHAGVPAFVTFERGKAK